MDIWDGALLVILAYVAIVSLVRLMAGHRDKYTQSLLDQMQQEQARKTQDQQPGRGREDAA